MKLRTEEDITIGDIVSVIELWDKEKDLLQEALKYYPNDLEMKGKILIYRLARIIEGHDKYGEELSVKKAYSYFCPNREIDIEHFFAVIAALLSSGVIESPNAHTYVENVGDILIGNWNSKAIYQKGSKNQMKTTEKSMPEIIDEIIGNTKISDKYRNLIKDIKRLF